jgi:hypothetical protein
VNVLQCRGRDLLTPASPDAELRSPKTRSSGGDLPKFGAQRAGSGTRQGSNRSTLHFQVLHGTWPRRQFARRSPEFRGWRVNDGFAQYQSTSCILVRSSERRRSISFLLFTSFVPQFLCHLLSPLSTARHVLRPRRESQTQYGVRLHDRHQDVEAQKRWYEAGCAGEAEEAGPRGCQ